MSGARPKKLVLAGDVGGTKTSLGLFSLTGRRPVLEVMASYPSPEASSLEECIARFLDEQNRPVSRACFGIAGPVLRGTSKTTNLPWVVSEAGILERFKWEAVRLVNDLVATARSVFVLEETELYEINRGVRDPEGNVGVVAPGTGLGMALMVFRDGRLHPSSSEGGHVDFAPKNDLELDLLRHLWNQWDHVSVERIASGPGLYTIYSWLRERGRSSEPPWLTERLHREDPPKVVSEAGLGEQDPVCVEALEIFVSIIGSAAGNLALTGVTTGGMYLGGGISPKILPRLKEDLFMEAFTAKGRFRSLLSQIPVKVILNDTAALLGAACCAFDI